MTERNYIAEINAFYDQLEINQLTSSAVALWHALMHINNKAAWSTTFTVAASVLQTKSGLKESMFKKARNELKQAGLIEWSSRKGNQSAIYQIKPLRSQYDHKYPVQSNGDRTGVGSSDHTGVYTGDRTGVLLNKQKEKKEKGCVNSFRYYEQIFGRGLSSFGIHILTEWIDRYKMPENLINYAMEITQEEQKSPKNKKMNTEKYLDGILKKWDKSGIRTLAEAKQTTTKTHQVNSFDVMLEKYKRGAEYESNPSTPTD